MLSYSVKARPRSPRLLLRILGPCLGLVVLSAPVAAVADGPILDPPPEAVNCARPWPQRQSDGPPPPLTPSLRLNEHPASISIELPDLPTSATCYTLMRFPADDNPVAFAWDWRCNDYPTCSNVTYLGGSYHRPGSGYYGASNSAYTAYLTTSGYYWATLYNSNAAFGLGPGANTAKVYIP